MPVSRSPGADRAEHTTRKPNSLQVAFVEKRSLVRYRTVPQNALKVLLTLFIRHVSMTSNMTLIDISMTSKIRV